MHSTFVIGDIHGGLRALREVLEKAPVNPGDMLIFVGDYADGWSETAPLVDFLIQLKEERPCIFLKGNHDAWCEEWLRTGLPAGGWLYNGGRTTIAGYAGYTGQQAARHLRFFESLKLYYTDAQNRLFVHAGYTAQTGPADETAPEHLYWDRTLWQTALAAGATAKQNLLQYPKRLRCFSEIFIGHTPTLYHRQTTPMNGCNVWNVDTGAGFTGPLTMMNVETKAFWQSQPLPQLYPGEKGRNR